MKTLKNSMIAFLAICMLSLGSCKKDSNTESLKANDIDNTNLMTERIFDDVGNLTMNALATHGGSLKAGKVFRSSETGCMTISFNLTTLPFAMILDFGSTNCPGSDGVFRRGKIIASFSGLTADSLGTITTTFENFFVNDNQIIGTRTMTDKGVNQAGHRNWDITVANASIILANNGGTISYQANHNNELIAGGNTYEYTDDVYSITGSSSGTTLGGRVFTSAITSPLIAKMSCAYLVSGVVEVSPQQEPVRTLNYGDGECDKLATVTVGDITFNILLPY